ncbi:MAG: class A beta-lactamase-related serine hydrolase [Chitinophagaceae bacterium]|nr:MAG: class A beta-lactamase-related serine hydrolase [Chitinophagaceae bacterium]
MKNKLGVLFIGVVVLAFASCKSPAMLAREKSIDDIVAKYASNNQPGASVLVFKDDKIVFQKGYGVRTVQTQEAITPNTNFRMASVTKQFTAMSILLLAQRGRLKLEDPLSKYFGSFPSYGKGIKIKHLLNHTSGLRDYEDLMSPKQTVALHDTNCLQLMYTTNSLYFQPGTQYKYSNTGYAILALVVEKVSGQDFASFLKENIFKPLKMTTSVAFEQGKSTVLNRAYGHSNENGAWSETDQSLTSAVLGDGGIYTNTVELTKWIKALWDYKLLSSDIQNAAWSRASLNNGNKIDYGMGWHIENYKNTTHPYHDGSSIGFRNSILVYPNEKLMVVILTNRNEGDPKEEASKIAALYLN